MIAVREIMNITYTKTITLMMALANKIINELNFVETINSNVTWDNSHWGISPGQLAKALVLSTFTDMRIPLTHIQDRLSDVDLRYLIGQEAMEHDINAFNVGRALERIGEANVDLQYQALAIKALSMYDIPTERIHSDTTTISFHGEYDIEKMNLTKEEKEEVLKITQGYNKDGRAGDCQILIGQMVGNHGIPISAKAMDGATSDIDWNKQALDVYDRLKTELGYCIYVADCKLVTEELVERMNNPSNKVSFVSRCPANFNNLLLKRVTRRAYLEDGWEELGQLGNEKRASSYRGVSLTESVFGTPMRLLVLESSALIEKAEISLVKAKEKLDPLIKTLEKKDFVCHADAEKECSRFIDKKELKLFSCKLEILTDIKEKWPPGRRGSLTKPVITKSYRIKVTNVEYDEVKRNEYMQQESTFVLISNISSDEKSDTELLKTYKGQHTVETSFRMLKNPSLASIIYLKNPKRVEALTMLLNFSLLIRAIIQYRMRDGLKKHIEKNPDEVIYAGWAGRLLKNPTFKLLYEHSINCKYKHIAFNDYEFIWPNVEIKELVLPLLMLMGLTPATIMQ